MLRAKICLASLCHCCGVRALQLWAYQGASFASSSDFSKQDVALSIGTLLREDPQRGGGFRLNVSSW